MVKFRSILAVVLAFVIVMLVSLGNVAEAKTKKPLSYTSEQIESVQEYASELSELRDRLPELATLIQRQDWIYVRNFIHGPLGEIRSKLLNVTRNLLPDAQPEARKVAKAVADNLVAIDRAALDSNYKVAVRNYAETVRDLDNFLQLLPQA